MDDGSWMMDGWRHTWRAPLAADLGLLLDRASVPFRNAAWPFSMSLVSAWSTLPACLLGRQRALPEPSVMQVAHAGQSRAVRSLFHSSSRSGVLPSPTSEQARSRKDRLQARSSIIPLPLSRMHERGSRDYRWFSEVAGDLIAAIDLNRQEAPLSDLPTCSIKEPLFGTYSGRPLAVISLARRPTALGPAAASRRSKQPFASRAGYRLHAFLALQSLLTVVPVACPTGTITPSVPTWCA